MIAVAVVSIVLSSTHSIRVAQKCDHTHSDKRLPPGFGEEDGTTFLSLKRHDNTTLAVVQDNKDTDAIEKEVGFEPGIENWPDLVREELEPRADQLIPISGIVVADAAENIPSENGEERLRQQELLESEAMPLPVPEWLMHVESGSLREGPMITDPKIVEVAVSRYAEDCEWILFPPFNRFAKVTIIYNKGAPDLPLRVVKAVRAVVNLPNVGRCDHTYAWHILKRLQWDARASDPQAQEPGSPPPQGCAKYTVFLPGSVELQARKLSRALQYFYGLPEALYENEPPVNIRTTFSKFKIKRYVASAPANRTKNPEERLFPAPQRPFGKWFDATFGKGTIGIGPSLLGGVLAGSRENIQRIPINVLKVLTAQLAMHSNPEVGHYMERLWGCLLFGYLTTEQAEEAVVKSRVKNGPRSVHN
jgi:hypothetical protein